MGGVVDIRESERVELDDFNPLFTDFLEVSFFERLVVRPVAESVEHCPHFDTFFYFFGEKGE